MTLITAICWGDGFQAAHTDLRVLRSLPAVRERAASVTTRGRESYRYTVQTPLIKLLHSTNMIYNKRVKSIHNSSQK